MQLNKNGKIPVLIIENEIEGDMNEVRPLEELGTFPNDIESNWEVGEKKVVWLDEYTPDDWKETVRNGMEFGGHDEAEIETEIAALTFEPYKEH